MPEPILSHEFENGLVLLAEPMASVESAAFSILVPAGSVYEAVDRSGLATVTCEMTQRGCGSRDSRQFITDLENLGVQRGESTASAHMSFGGAYSVQKSACDAADLCRLIAAAPFAGRSIRCRPTGGAAGIAVDRRRS